jgi:putative flippase GtrA
MAKKFHMQKLFEVVRYYQAGALNAAFGYGLYALLVWLGAGVYLAQLLAHILGVLFNYITYSQHVFRDSEAAKFRFLLSYFVNYMLSVLSLYLLSLKIASPYLSGLISILVVSFVNYFILKFLVFVRVSRV